MNTMEKPHWRESFEIAYDFIAFSECNFPWCFIGCELYKADTLLIDTMSVHYHLHFPVQLYCVSLSLNAD